MDKGGEVNFKKIRLIIGVLFCSLILPAMLYSQDVNELLLDDFEGEIAGGEQGTVDYEARVTAQSWRLRAQRRLNIMANRPWQ